MSDEGYFARRHRRVGWSAMLSFMVLGLLLETLHAFKVGLYVDADAETRRLMWTLAHAHGTLIGLIHLAFASHLGELGLKAREVAWTSSLLLAATVLLPGGFFAGGVTIHGADPGAGVLLAPVGALLLIAAVALCTRAAWRG